MDSKYLLVFALATAIFTSQLSFEQTQSLQAFQSYQQEYSKSYNTDEEAYRLAVYMTNVHMINEHNSKNGETYTMGINQFSDLTENEFASIYLGTKTDFVATEPEEVHEDFLFQAVGDVNWVSSGKVQKVKDQGSCGSCWAFSSAAATESLKGIKKGSVGDFSEQELVSCCSSYYGTCQSQGCDGGYMQEGFTYYKTYGICKESSYPYKGTSSYSSCAVNSCSKDSFTISGYSTVSRGSTSSLQSAISKNPVSVAVDASNWSSYKSGTFSNCGTSLNHGVLAAGYTSSYWLVKNSWGKSWGESGYIRVKSGNTCGIANQASYPK